MALPRRTKVGGKSESVGWRFDARNQAAISYAERAAARYVTRVSSETRAALQNMIVRSIENGVSARDTARLIQQTVGLTSQGTAAVNNYYNHMISIGHPPAKASALTQKYSDKLLRVRANNIARTEIMGALNAGALEQARQKQEAGVFSKNAVKKWIITHDEVTCPKCRPMEGQTKPITSTFSNGVTAPPAHPSCRCSLSFDDPMPETDRSTPAASFEMMTNPGHSVERWGGEPPEEAPEEQRRYFYHNTPLARLKAIGQSGLRPSRDGGLSLSTNLSNARFWHDMILERAEAEGTPEAARNLTLVRLGRAAVTKLMDEYHEGGEVHAENVVKPDKLQVWSRGAWAPVTDVVAWLFGKLR